MKKAIEIRDYHGNLSGYLDAETRLKRLKRMSFTPDLVDMNSLVNNLNSTASVNVYSLVEVEDDFEFED